MNGKVNYTLITGASTGIGKAMAEECANRKQNLILVALPESGLQEVAVSLKNKYGVDVKVVELNLTEPTALQGLYDWCCNQNLSVNVLINNAGTGNYSAFETTPLDKYLSIIRLNAEVVVSLSKLFLPKLREHRESYILNLGSFVALMPVPYKSVYSASKSFVLTFSRALQSELRQYGVHVSCLCPGPTLTESVIKRNQQLIEQSSGIMTLTAETVAKAGIDGLFRKKGVIVPGWKNRMILQISKLVPFRLKSYILNNIFKDNMEEQEDSEATPAAADKSADVAQVTKVDTSRIDGEQNTITPGISYIDKPRMSEKN